MADKHLPYIRFFPGDWLRDQVSGCSLAAQGLWLRLMMIAHDSDRYGFLSVNGRPISPEDLARRCGCPLDQFRTLLDELSRAGVPSRDKRGVLYSRRMERDNREYQNARKNGSKGGNPKLLRGKEKQGVNPPVNPLVNMTPDSESENGKGGAGERGNGHGGTADVLRLGAEARKLLRRHT